MRTDAPLRVHWVRHGHISSHRGDIPLTDEGLRQAEAFGQRLNRELIAAEIVSFLYAPTRRARETAAVIHSVMAAMLDNAESQQVQLLAPLEHAAIRNPDIYVAGTRIELVSTAEALAEQIPSSGLSLEDLAQLHFMQDFWKDSDRIGYWVKHPNPPGEDANTVARRLLTFAASLLDLPRAQPRRYVCVTHSPTMRALVRRYLLGHDPGEPGYLEAVDMDFTSGGSCTINYRGNSRTINV